MSRAERFYRRPQGASSGKKEILAGPCGRVVRGEGRGLFCKKAPFLPPAPPIHPAKNSIGRMKGSAFPPGRPLTASPPVRRRFFLCCDVDGGPRVCHAAGGLSDKRWPGRRGVLSSSRQEFLKGKGGAGGKGGLFAKSPLFPPPKTSFLSTRPWACGSGRP